MALVQLFAWMSDALLFRMGRVPELHFVKFLQLLGIQQQPAEPARAWLTFPLAENQQQALITIPRLSQVAVGDDPDTIFETDESVNALALRVSYLAIYNPQLDQPDLITPTDAPNGNPLELSGALKQLAICLKYPEKFTEKADDVPETQLSLTIFADTSEVPAKALVSCGDDVVNNPNSARVVWEFLESIDAAGSQKWCLLPVDRDSTASLTRTGQVLLRTPAVGKWRSNCLVGINNVTATGFWLRARLASGSYEDGRCPKLLAIRTNTVLATQAQSHQREILGRSTGEPNQVFQLSFSPVLAGTLELLLDEGIEGAVRWQEVPDFFGSGPEDSHYVLDRATGEVRFGDGQSGRIPVATDKGDGIVAHHYRHGGGKRGNLPAGRINQLLSLLSGVDDSSVHNPVASLGGRDEETLQQAMARAPQELKNKDRAVTAEDYEQLSLRVPGIARARALPMAHPRFPCQPIPGAVTVVVVPDSTLPAPLPSEELLRSVCRWLEPRRVLTAEVFVKGPTYSNVSVNAEIVVQGASDLAEVARGVELTLLRYFHPLTGGESGKGWEFGGTIYYSLVYRQVLAVNGVERIGNLTVSLDQVPMPPCVDIPLPAGNLATSHTHTILSAYSGA
jgi:hypothetical protein